MESSDPPLTSEYEAIARRLADGWRMRCPHGHSDLRDGDGPSVFCKTCGAAYHYADLVDAREADSLRLVSPPDHRHP